MVVDEAGEGAMEGEGGRTIAAGLLSTLVLADAFVVGVDAV